MRSHFDSHSLFASRKTWLVREEESPNQIKSVFHAKLFWKFESVEMVVAQEREGRKRSCKIANDQSNQPQLTVLSDPDPVNEAEARRGEARRCLRPCPSSRPCCKSTSILVTSAAAEMHGLEHDERTVLIRSR